jgi:hypothetical protein
VRLLPVEDPFDSAALWSASAGRERGLIPMNGQCLLQDEDGAPYGLR